MKIGGMHCAGCAPPIEAALKLTPGVLEARVSYEAEEGIVRYDERTATVEKIVEGVRELGYTAEIQRTLLG